MRPTLRAALAALTGSSVPAPSLDIDEPSPAAPPGAGTLSEALVDASSAIDALDTALEELRRSLEELNRLAEEQNQ